METSLHAELKQIYADDNQVEVRLQGFRVDAIQSDATLVEIQHGSLGAIRDKIRKLLRDHDVLIVKPIVARKRILKLDAKDGEIVHRRWSPKRGSLINFFEDFVYFTTVFPHPRLRIEAVTVDIEEIRFPRVRRRRRRRKDDFQVADQMLLERHDSQTISTPDDLLNLLPSVPSAQWDTSDLAKLIGVNRWIAQRIAYCLRETGAAKLVGKNRNTLLYQVA